MKVIPRFNAIPGGGSNVAVRRSIWQCAGPFDARLRRCEDWEMWIRLAKHGAPACVSRPLVAYRVHDANMSLDVGGIVDATKLIETLHDTTADWGRVHRWLAESYLRRGQRFAAVGQFLRAAVHGQPDGVIADIGDILRRRLTRRRERDSDPTFARDPWIAAAAEWLRPLYGHNDDGSQLRPQAQLTPQPPSQR